MTKRPIFTLAVSITAAVLLAGCGIFLPTARDRAAKATPGFKAGYSDGCASATLQDANYRAGQIRDENMFNTDKHYRTGWTSGFTNCRTQRTQNPAAGPIPDNHPGGHRY